MNYAKEEAVLNCNRKCNLIRRYYRRLISKIVSRSWLSEICLTERCSEIEFDNYGNCVEILCRLLFYHSDIYLGDKLLGYFYGRSLGFWGSTNCTCRIGKNRIKFKTCWDGIRVVDRETHECLLLKAPRHRFLSRFRGRITVELSDGTEMVIDPPMFVSDSLAGLPAYTRLLFGNGVII